MQVNYIHIRDHDDDKQLINFGGATIAYTEHRIADSILVNYSVAECTPEDRFVKAIGRTISRARLDNSEYMGTMEIPADMEDEIQKLIVHDYLNYKNEFWKNEFPDLDIKEFWYPHHRGYVEDTIEAPEGEVF